jgi:hypothetical protein
VASIDVDALAAAVRQRAPAGPLDRVEIALAVGVELASGADELIEQFVIEARHAGNSWTEIGARMGVSKQAARQRFVTTGTTAPARAHNAGPPVPRARVLVPGRERFTGSAPASPEQPHRRLRRLGVTAVGPRCSFCGEPSSDSLRLIAGPGVYICAECVGQCAEILVTPDGPTPAQ